MRHRTISIALLIAASLTPVAGCSDKGGQADPDQANNDLAAEQDNSQTGKGSPMPVNNPNSKKQDAKPSSGPSELDKRTKQLQQQIDDMKAADQKRLDRQSKRISKLEDQVKGLTIRLRRLPQPSAKDKQDKQDKQDKKPDNAPTPDAVSPQADTSSEPREPKPTADKTTDKKKPADDGAESSNDSEPKPATSSDTAKHAVARCPSNEAPSDQFDVVYQAADRQALNVASDKIKTAGLSDWFARPGTQRVYVGRYGPCSLAERRRSDVQDRTGLAFDIATVRPHKTNTRSAPRRTRTSRHADHDYGADQAPASIARAPFHIIGVEIRGTHHFLGVAPSGPYRLDDVTWLSPGDSYAGWTLRDIRTDAGTAMFNNDNDNDNGRVAVALPSRG